MHAEKEQKFCCTTRIGHLQVDGELLARCAPALALQATLRGTFAGVSPMDVLKVSAIINLMEVAGAAITVSFLNVFTVVAQLPLFSAGSTGGNQFLMPCRVGGLHWSTS